MNEFLSTVFYISTSFRACSCLPPVVSSHGSWSNCCCCHWFLTDSFHFFVSFFDFTILYWFCHTLTWIRHGCTWVPNPEPLSHLPPHTISLGYPSAPAPSTSPRMDWLDLLAVQVTLKSLLQHHTSKASILQLSAFFTVQLSHPYITTGKTIALTRRTFVGKVMSPLLNMLSRLVITFLPRSKCPLISWLQSP